tara:strand:- start:280 stop:438 length:159 start_codon:yes stop_codon:yes gene_type:complete
MIGSIEKAAVVNSVEQRVEKKKTEEVYTTYKVKLSLSIAKQKIVRTENVRKL